MTKQEKILKAQVKELERLVEIKDAVIEELKTLIRPIYTYSHSNPPYTITATDGTNIATTTGLVRNDTTRIDNQLSLLNQFDGSSSDGFE